jgi:DNA transformation protein and related proteins
MLNSEIKVNLDKAPKLQGLGAMSWNMLNSIGIQSPKALLERDPFDVYADLYRMNVSRNLNMLYALIGATENTHWQIIARERRTEILLRLDEMGIAPGLPRSRREPLQPSHM